MTNFFLQRWETGMLQIHMLFHLPTFLSFSSLFISVPVFLAYVLFVPRYHCKWFHQYIFPFIVSSYVGTIKYMHQYLLFFVDCLFCLNLLFSPKCTMQSHLVLIFLPVHSVFWERLFLVVASLTKLKLGWNMLWRLLSPPDYGRDIALHWHDEGRCDEWANETVAI